MDVRTRLFAFASLLIFSAVACAKPPPKHEYTLLPGQAHGPGMRSALVAPLNATLDRPKGLEVADERIDALLDAHLESKGLSVTRASASDFRRAASLAARRVEKERLTASTGTVSSEISFEELVPVIFEILEVEPDLLILPNVVMRHASANGGSTFRWDGVRRRETGSASGSFTGEGFEVSSLFVAAYRADGTRVFSGFGGLDTIYEFVWAKRGMELRQDRLQNEEYLAEGVCIAFYPFFGEDERC
ncbi:MAG: hypothetical protein H6748_16190 [Spirochaetaceae bacterium]|nr:hypothetical protein [Myxococcales bacterium]MCB9725588.1 hypothetical protein [Spirochaetaceae bacterium]HPG25399.1 hypothetical protein [Myxococcota bacterium]